MSVAHLVGLAGDVPASVVARAGDALSQLGAKAATTLELPGLTLVLGQAEPDVVTIGNSRLGVLAGTLFSDAPSDDHDGGDALEAAMRRWGDHAPRDLRFEGVLVDWDGSTRGGYAARDHLGHASLYWMARGAYVVFATEIRLLVETVEARPGPSATGIALWLGLDASRPELTLYEGVAQVPSGHRLVLTPEETRVVPYWQPEYQTPQAWNMDEAADALRPMLQQAVRRRLAANGKTGVLMSGGLDSSAVAALAHSLGADVTSYSGVFPGQEDRDESEWIDAIVRFLDVDSVRVVSKPQGVLASLIEFTRRWSLPPDGSGYWWRPLWRQPAIDGVGTVLTGDGGDEIFDIRFGLIADSLRKGRFISAYRLARGAPRMWFYPPPRVVASLLRRAAADLTFPAVTRGLRRLGRVQAARAPSWLAPALVTELQEARDEAGWSRLRGPRWWTVDAHHLTTRVPTLGMLPLSRRLGEAAGYRFSAPLFDVDLVMTTLRSPPQLGFHGALSKPLLRAASTGYLPDSVRLRPGKTVFHNHFLEGIRLEAGAIDRLLRNPRAEVRAYVDRDAMLRDLDSLPTVAGAEAAFPLYRLAALECWLQHERDPSFIEQVGVIPWEFEVTRTRQHSTDAVGRGGGSAADY